MSSQGLEIIAHRGASHDAPENTLTAVQAGFAQGADACEVDVHITRDQRIIVMHDADTFRTAGVSNRIVAENWEALRDLDVCQWGKWLGSDFSEPAPLLDEILRWIPEGKRLFVEIKCGPEVLPELARIVAASQRTNEIVIIGFDYETMRLARERLPKLEVYWLASPSRTNVNEPPVAELIAKARAAKLSGLNLQHRFPIDSSFVKSVHAAGMKLYVWTVDEPAIARQLAEAGIDGITTNRPRWLRERISNLSGSRSTH